MLAAWAAVTAVRGAGIGRTLTAWALVLEAGLLLQAAVAVVALVSGRGPAQAATPAGYLAASVLVLPVAVVHGRRGGTRWDALVVCVAGIAVAAVVVRLHTTWDTT